MSAFASNELPLAGRGRTPGPDFYGSISASGLGVAGAAAGGDAGGRGVSVIVAACIEAASAVRSAVKLLPIAARDRSTAPAEWVETLSTGQRPRKVATISFHTP